MSLLSDGAGRVAQPGNAQTSCHVIFVSGRSSCLPINQTRKHDWALSSEPEFRSRERSPTSLCCSWQDYRQLFTSIHLNKFQLNIQPRGSQRDRSSVWARRRMEISYLDLWSTVIPVKSKTGRIRCSACVPGLVYVPGFSDASTKACCATGPCAICEYRLSGWVQKESCSIRKHPRVWNYTAIFTSCVIVPHPLTPWTWISNASCPRLWTSTCMLRNSTRFGSRGSMNAGLVWFQRLEMKLQQAVNTIARTIFPITVLCPQGNRQFSVPIKEQQRVPFFLPPFAKDNTAFITTFANT